MHAQAAEAQLSKEKSYPAPKTLQNSAAAKTGSGSTPASATGAPSEKRKPVRVYMDGVFDLMHYGHSNALRQARAVGDVLVVGLVNDAEVVKNKGTPPVMPEDERYAALSACKWVGEVIRDAPYDLTEEWVTRLVTEYNIDYIVHGDDPCITADGKDAYAYAKSIGKYKQVKRTEGVSTTDIVGRMLLMNREHHVSDHHSHSGDKAAVGGAGDSSATPPSSGLTSGSVVRNRTGSLRSLRSSSITSLASLTDHHSHEGEGEGEGGEHKEEATAARSATPPPTVPVVHSKFLPTARRIMQFADGKVPKPEDKVVYMCGSFDLFNAGHIEALREARKRGDFLLVGIHDDATVNKLRGHGLPILNLYERTLSLLSCKYVDEVIIGAPWVITEELIKTMNISTVVRGSISDYASAEGHEAMGWTYDAPRVATDIEDEYAVPKAQGILATFTSPRTLTALDIIIRIFDQRSMFQSRYDRKSKMETTYVQNKTYVQEA